eukprot:TRINITY_DN4145_c0_g2_i2.p1 TRINITY_DN4145_c0_g2~~TRINITY_DN4145_c0_g2_i2.p1  ORF type:complete len:479 (-),score=110.46 TRINITY_DN4145_c0_g2_i2:393-1829(-)
MVFFLLFWSNINVSAIRTFLIWWWNFQTILKVKFASQLSGFGDLSSRRNVIAISQGKTPPIRGVNGLQLCCFQSATRIELWMWKNRSWLKAQFWVAVAIAFWIFTCLITAVLVFFVIRTRDEAKLRLVEISASSDLCRNYYMGIAFLVSSLGYIWWFVPGALVAFRSLKIKENFRLIDEIKTVLTFYLLYAFLGFFVRISGGLNRYLLGTEIGVYYIINGFALRTLELILKYLRLIYWTYESQRRLEATVRSQSEPGSPSRDSVGAVLERNFEAELMRCSEDQEGAEIFEEFLRAEFAIENLFFIQACHKLHQLFPKTEERPSKLDRKKFKKVAVAMRDKFILDNSPLTINLPHQIRKRIEHALERFPVEDELSPRLTSFSDLDSITKPTSLELDKVLDSVVVAGGGADQKSSGHGNGGDDNELEDEDANVDFHLFDQAEREILKLITTDSFTRFVKTEQYRAWNIKRKSLQADHNSL